MLGERADGVVEQITGKASGLAVEAQRFVNDARELGGIATVEAPLEVGIPAGMVDPGAEIESAASHFVDREWRGVLFPVPEGSVKRAAEFFVGIDGEDPVVGGLLGSEIFLVGVVGPGAGKEFGVVLAGDFFGAVDAAGVDDDNLVGDANERAQGAREIFFFVERDDAGGNANHRIGDATWSSIS